MKHLELLDLHNAENINAILTTREGFITAGYDQGFQIYPKRIELWQKLPDRRLLKVKGWTTSVIATYTK